MLLQLLLGSMVYKLAQTLGKLVGAAPGLVWPRSRLSAQPLQAQLPSSTVCPPTAAAAAVDRVLLFWLIVMFDDQVTDQLRQVQQALEVSLRDKLISATTLQLSEQQRSEADAELRKAQESLTAALTRHAAEAAVADEKLRVAEQNLGQLQAST
jgi:hypothetical protein